MVVFKILACEPTISVLIGEIQALVMEKPLQMLVDFIESGMAQSSLLIGGNF
jgi:hypothetical protein